MKKYLVFSHSKDQAAGVAMLNFASNYPERQGPRMSRHKIVYES